MDKVELQINGLPIEIHGNLVRIIDVLNDVTDKEVKTILLYLYDEGFTDLSDTRCELVINSEE